jgi:hypothetical protein
VPGARPDIRDGQKLRTKEHGARYLSGRVVVQAMSEIPAIPSSRDKLLRCPIGKACHLRMVNEQQVFAECISIDSGRCENVLSFGGGSYCRVLWKYGTAK